ncbi:acyltransferase family protein [Pedobacter sp. WC2501]|uniref:acyltransferase family protein n=1 Tax=Pedobacter sp. WC2501 TaxID=3461400 RepID=UPI004045443F
MNKKRFLELDIVKAVCIVLVVIGHYLPANSPDWYVMMNKIIYSFHMPAFMFISGYVYISTFKPVNYVEFIGKKFKRLMIPYFTVSSLVIILKLLSPGNLSLDSPVGVDAFYRQIYEPMTAGAFLWFIYVLFMIFLIVPFFDNTYKRLFLLAISLILFFIPVHFTDYLSLDKFKGIFLFFVVGMVSSMYGDYIKRYFSVKLLIMAFGAFGVLFFMKFRYPLANVFLSKTQYLAIALLGIYILMTISTMLSKKEGSLSSLLFKLSISSYTIYLFHTTFQGFAKALFNRMPIGRYVGNELTFIIIACLVIAVGIIGPYILEKVVSRFRVFSFLLGINYKRK